MNNYNKKSVTKLIRKIHDTYSENIKHVLKNSGYIYTIERDPIKSKVTMDDSVKEVEMDMSTHTFDAKYLKKIVGIALIACLTLFTGCGKVGTGERGMKVTWGEVVSVKPLDEGLYFFLPFTTTLITYNVKEQIAAVKTPAFTKDIQEIILHMVVNFRVIDSEVINLHKYVGKDYIDIVILPKIPDIAKNVIGKWEADQIVSKREEAVKLITEQLRESVKKHGIDIICVNLVNIDFKDAFEEAVEAKQIAAQNAIKAKNETARVEEEAKQKLVTAEAEAKAMQVRAEALTKNKSLVEYEAVQKWDGKLPVYMMGNTVPFMSINELNKKKEEK